MRPFSRLRRRTPAQLPPLTPPPGAAWWIIPAALAIGGTTWWLLAALPVLPEVEAAKAHIEIVRTALAAGTGVGGAIALLLVFRRQRHHEITTAHSVHDAEQRRITELYTSAAEQLGSDKPPVRLAGLYVLERLAQDAPSHRQTVVNVICAYLRMPYAPPDPVQARRRHRTIGATPNTAGQAVQDLEGERQVRLTAQRILTDHLRRPAAPYAADPRFWKGIQVDLTGATLIDFDFCHTTRADFGGATFTGNAMFSRATFTGAARFGGATFTRTAWFDDAIFAKGVVFDEVVVEKPEAAHKWPEGWRVELTPEGNGRLILDGGEEAPEAVS